MPGVGQTRNLSAQIGVLLETLELGGDERTVKSALRQFSKAAGLKRYAYVSVGSDGLRTLTDLPQDWEKKYHGEQYAVVDPVVEHARRTLKPFCWSFSTMEMSQPAVRDYCEAIGEEGVVSGMTIPTQAGFGQTAMLTFMTDDGHAPRFDVKSLQKAVSAVAYTHLYASRPDFVAMRAVDHSLTPREMACVVWTSLGKNKGEIALMFGLSEKTVRFHIENARSKLNATNAPHLVRLAFEAGILPMR